MTLHPEHAHDLLAPDDLPSHLGLHHPDIVLEALGATDQARVAAWLERNGVPSEDDPELDLCQMLHSEAHAADELADEVVTLLAELIGLVAAPYSQPELTLDLAAKVWVKLRERLHLLGWSPPEEVEAALRRVLGREVAHKGAEGEY